MTTSAQRDENRLTDEDRARIRTRLAELREEWRTNGHRYRPAYDATIVERVGAHAIGCATYDLRDSELAEILAMMGT